MSDPHITQFEAEMTGRKFASQIRGHQPVVGSDGEPVGTVDAVEGDRIKLTRQGAEGRHHYVPLSAVANVDHSVRLGEPAADAVRHWQGGGTSSDGGLR